jgi:hypothetical protein
MERYSKTLDRNMDGVCYAKMYVAENGEWVKFEDVKKLIIKLTQDGSWNDPSIEPIEKSECFIMLSDGQIHPALMVNNNWVKPAGYPYDFNFNQADVIKWRYNLKYQD